MRPRKTISEAISGAFQNICPSCERGQIFSSFLSMREKCDVCGIVYEREPGYFLGALSFSYAIAFFVVLPTFLPLLFANLPIWVIVGVPALETAIMAPFLFRYSRLIWIHLDRRVDGGSLDPKP